LEGGPPKFRQGFTCPALLKDLKRAVAYGALTHCGPPFQAVRLTTLETTGLFRFRSPLLAEPHGRPRLAPGTPVLMSFPPGTEMFQFPGFAS
jgi:hypothetical protein